MKNQPIGTGCRKLQHETLENRICLTASVGWDGPGQGSATLTYTVGDAPAAVGQETFEAAIETALDVWSDVVDVEFVETDRVGLRNSIDFTFGHIDGSGNVLAQAYFPDDLNPGRIAGDVKFDASESWEIGNSRGHRATDLVWVAVHEIGHSLGLEHEHDHEHAHDAVMATSVSPNTVFRGLDQHDIDAALELYAPADSRMPATPVKPVVDTGLVNVPTNNPIAPSPDFDTPVDQPAEDSGDEQVDNDKTDRSPRWRGPRSRGWNRWTVGFRSWRSPFFFVPDVEEASPGEDSSSDADETTNWRISRFKFRPIWRIRIWRI